MNQEVRTLQKFITNKNLPIIKGNWEGNPLDKQGRFVNHEYPFLPEFGKLWKWQRENNPQKQEKKNETFRLETVSAAPFLRSKKDGICWLGHASFLIRLNGKLLLIDPVFESPSLLMKRFSTLPFELNDLQMPDYLLLSHDHRDHLDEKSVKYIFSKKPDVPILTGLGMSPILKSWNKNANIEEAGWYQQYSLTGDALRIYYLPARHWGRRTLTDTNKRLWGAFVLQTDKVCIYFGADSGYGSHFKEVSELFGQIDFAMMGIGAYKPEWFMHSSHTSPADALRAATDTKTKNFIPMHYGTFDLADEPLGDPYRTVSQLYHPEKFAFNLLLPKIGEIIDL